MTIPYQTVHLDPSSPVFGERHTRPRIRCKRKPNARKTAQAARRKRKAPTARAHNPANTALLNLMFPQVPAAQVKAMGRVLAAIGAAKQAELAAAP